MVTVFEQRATSLEQPFNLDLTWDRSRAYTVNYKTYNELLKRGKLEQKNDLEEGRSADDRYLIIDSYCEIEVYDRISELAPITRPRILVMLGIITFVTGKALTPFGFFNSHTSIAKPGSANPEKEPYLVLDGHEYSKELKEILGAMHVLPIDQQTLIYSLLDRWRKACYLEEESEDSYLYEDETILACFHILELLGNQYGNHLDNDTNVKVQAFTIDVLENVFFIQNKNIQAELAKLIHTTLSGQKTVKPKILRMLQEIGLLQPKSKALIERFLGHRNAIAHGRENLYEAKAAIYPLKPYFNHLKDIYEDIDTIRIVSARAIAAFLGTSLWKEEWDNLIENEVPVYEEVQAFNKAKLYEGMTWQEVESGTMQGVNVAVLIHYYRKGPLAFPPFGIALSKYIREVELSEDNAYLVLYTSAILADSTDASIAAASQKQMAALYDSQLLARHEIRDVLKELTYQGKDPRWLKAYLIERSEARQTKQP
jgi:hypothetical protein